MSHECSLSLPGSHDTRGWIDVLVSPIRTTWSFPQSSTSKLTGRSTDLMSHELLCLGPRGPNVCDVAIECDYFST